ncbi:MAG: hypothetical protein Q9227_009468 [Pyrenula ochraceoflavens]
MRLRTKLLVLGLGSPVFADVHRYWIDESCSRFPPNHHSLAFEDAFDSALGLARRARLRLHDDDDQYMTVIFDIIFSNAPDRQAQVEHPAYQFLDSKCTCLSDNVDTAGFTGDVTTWLRERRSRMRSNYRFYCDNDVQDATRATRWTLRPDPWPPLPLAAGYVRNAERPPWPPRYPGQQVQEYEDVDNGMYMGFSNGCQSPNVQAKTYTQGYPLPRQPFEKATVTICNFQFEGSPVHDIFELFENEDRRDFIQDSPLFPDFGGVLWNLRAMTSMVLLREWTLLPPFNPTLHPYPEMISSAKYTGSCPLYCADFDPQNNGLLVVAGGGGESKSGVGNKIVLLNTSRREKISELVEINLSTQEDSVSSLAVAISGPTYLTALAGINSSISYQNANGENKHLRSFRIDHPSQTLPESSDAQEKHGNGGKSTALARTAFFRPSTATKKETYQRILRLSPSETETTQRIAAIASSLAPEEEIVVFRAVSAPQKSDEIFRIPLGRTEAADIDISPKDEEGNFHLAYCTDSNVYTVEIPDSPSKTQTKPSIAHSMPAPDNSKPPSRIKLRALRFLNPNYLLLLQNRPQRSGADLVVLHLSDLGNLGSVILEKRLAKTTKSAVSFDVCHLSASTDGDRQIVIAVASQSGSIEILTLDYSPRKGIGKFKQHALLKNVGHPASITKLAFSTFRSPPLPIGQDIKAQSIKLASTSIANTVVVHTLPLSPEPVESRTPRYVLTPNKPSEFVQTTLSVTMALLVIGFAAFLLQAFTEIRGGVPPMLGAQDWLSPRVSSIIARPYMPPNPNPLPTANIPVSETSQPKLQDMIVQHSASETPKAIVVRDTGTELAAEAKHDAELVRDETVKKWEELEEHQRVGWRKRLMDAGQWAEGQGEAILKGVFFSELAGAVGDMVRGA